MLTLQDYITFKRYNGRYCKAGHRLLTLPDDISPNVTVIAKHTIYKNIEVQMQAHWAKHSYTVEEVVFVRHPAATWASITKKGYAKTCKTAAAVVPHEMEQDGAVELDDEELLHVMKRRDFVIAAVAEKSAEADLIYAKALASTSTTNGKHPARWGAKVVYSERWIKNPASVCTELRIGGGCSNSSSLVLSEYNWHSHNTQVLGSRMAQHLPPFGDGGYHGGTVKQQPIPRLSDAVMQVIRRLQPNLMKFYDAISTPPNDVSS